MKKLGSLLAELLGVNLKVPGCALWSMAFQQQQRATAELRIRFGQTFSVNHFYHREYIDFHRKMLKPLKIMLGNRTLHGRKGISAALRGSCVLIVSSICRIWALRQVGILLLNVWRDKAGDQGRASGLKLDLVQRRDCSAGFERYDLTYQRTALSCPNEMMWNLITEHAGLVGFAKQFSLWSLRMWIKWI